MTRCMVTVRERQIGYMASCDEHDVYALDIRLSRRQAIQTFLCDRGENLRFLISTDEEDDVPFMTDLGGMVHSLRSVIEDRHYGFNNCPDMRVWRVAHTAPMTLALHPTKLLCIDAGEWDENSYKSMLWMLKDENDQNITEFRVSIDGSV